MWFAQSVYRPHLEILLRWRYVTAAVGIAALILTVGMVLGGWIAFHFFPTIEADFMNASITMPQGTPAHVTSEAVQRLEAGAKRLRREMMDETGLDYFRHVYAAVGDQPRASTGEPGAAFGGTTAGHVGGVMVELAPAEDRELTSEQLGNRWREATGPIPEAVGLTFSSSAIASGEDLDIMFIGRDMIELRRAADEVKVQLRGFSGVHSITDTFLEGKAEMQLAIKPAAETLGLTLQHLGQQVRQAFYGEEAQRIQRGRDDIRVMVRYPVDERRSLGDLENMRIRTPDGAEVPFRQVADVNPSRGFASIRRVDRNRAVNVSATVDEAVTSSGDIVEALQAEVLPGVLARHPGVYYSLEGMQAEQRDAIAGLRAGFAIALFAIFALLAIPLKSYVQPLIIMSAIPFGLVGAVWGHMLLGYNVTLLSMFGLVALTGVVVNDSLIMVAFINKRREEHIDLQIAVREAGVGRFRPIILTSLTTFFGLVPLMAERSIQAAFLIPMAVSLAFGVLFATVITLVLVPAAYMILDDVGRGMRRLVGRGPIRNGADVVAG